MKLSTLTKLAFLLLLGCAIMAVPPANATECWRYSGCAGGADLADPTDCEDCPEECPPDSDDGDECDCSKPEDYVGMSRWWVSEPQINVRLEDEPLGYFPALGARISFRLSYRQRGSVVESPSVFGVGTNWTTSFRAFAVGFTNSLTGQQHYRMHSGGGGYVSVAELVPDYRDCRKVAGWWSGSIPGCRVEYRSGASAVYSYAFPHPEKATETMYFMTEFTDPRGNATTYNYSTAGGILRLTGVTDGDGHTTTLYYENTTHSNLITRVVDPFLRTNLLHYNAAGLLTNIVDVAGISSTFAYDAGSQSGWITNMATPYGTTTFEYGGSDLADGSAWTVDTAPNRFVRITKPNGGKHLYMYRHDCSDFLAGWTPTQPTTTPYTNTFDDIDLDQRNSYHWGPRQYALLSTGDPSAFVTNDFRAARYRHWLRVDSQFATPTLSVERAPSPDGTAEGQVTWFDYGGKVYGDNYAGTNALPLFKARVLPDGTSWFRRIARNSRVNVAEVAETYTPVTGGSPAVRTNTYIYGTNAIDVTMVLGPNNEQVLSNYFGPLNFIHAPDASYNALDHETRYTYNGYGQLLLVQSPSGLTTSNYFVPSGDAIHRLASTADWEIGRANSYSYYANGLIYAHTDERGLTTTNYWDNLQRHTGVLYPDGTTVSNRYTALDLTAAKDRLGAWSYVGYNQVRQKVAETNANGAITRYGYCDCGSLMALTNE